MEWLLGSRIVLRALYRVNGSRFSLELCSIASVGRGDQENKQHQQAPSESDGGQDLPPASQEAQAQQRAADRGKSGSVFVVGSRQTACERAGYEWKACAILRSSLVDRSEISCYCAYAAAA